MRAFGGPVRLGLLRPHQMFSARPGSFSTEKVAASQAAEKVKEPMLREIIRRLARRYD